MQISRRAFLAGTVLLPVDSHRRADALVRFRQQFKGAILVPGDGDYERARAIASVNPRTEKRPRLIARCENADDVLRALEFGRTQSLEIAVRGGGHDLLGASVCEDGLVIDLSPMKGIRVDPARRRAYVQAGARSRDLNGTTEPYGLAAALGCHPDVGVAGLTLGGGLGWFLGRYGTACDNLHAAHVITADGKRHLARTDENADLFWALRGGGGNFGIVTELELQLHAVGPVLGGPIAFRSDVGAFLRFFRDFMKAAPDPLVVETSIVMADQPVILCTVCWSGELTEGERVLAPLRGFGSAADGIASRSYARLTDRLSADFSALAFGPPPIGARPTGRIFDYWKGGSLDALSDPVITQIVAIMQSAARGMSVGLGHYIHGQVCRVPATETSVVRNAGQLTYFIDANWRDAARADAAMAWVDRSWQAMQAYSSRSTYINYLSRQDDDAVRAAYQSNILRLVALKRRFDPSNIFHLNRNIRP